MAGAGTMGSGIALAAAQNDFSVVLFDTNETVLEKARNSINKNLDFLLDKQKITISVKESISSNIHLTSSINDCIADLVIEAIIEKEDAKVNLFTQLAAINASTCIFASNTSSLSINSLQKRIAHLSRVAGMHFFNPANIMKLVEVVKAADTSDEVVETLMETCRKLNKTPVLCIDAPGFIVNRVARHYYLEAMHLVESGMATIESVDELMESSGFKMGPFKLMDLIGMDINLAVSQSLYEAFDHAQRFKPSRLQEKKVQEGNLGKKTGKGFYQY